MNDYNDYYDYYLMNNRNYDTYNSYQSNPQILDLYDGYIKGNIFENLYDKYKKYDPIQPKIVTEKEKDLLEIQAYRFALIDLDLYLDIYPNNSYIINIYNEISTNLKRLISNYETKYGPLSISFYDFKTPWNWLNSPWPWEVNN